MSNFSKRQFEGKTLEEAIERAEKELGLSKDKFIYDILRESGGVFGFGQKVVIEVSPRPADVNEEEIERGGEVKGNSPSNGNVQKKMLEFFEGLLERLNESGKIEITEEDRKIIVRAALDEGSIFLNRKGHTIDSIKHLLSLIAIREGAIGKRVSIFIAEKPSDSNLDLVEMAKEIKEKVEQHHRTIALGGMDSKTRKVFHSALGRDPNITTYSEGEGANRKLYVEKRGRINSHHNRQYIKRNNRGGKRHE
ncbi:MAG: Jag N-terminal domain-containing protein [Myxococcota bacterium]